MAGGIMKCLICGKEFEGLNCDICEECERKEKGDGHILR